MKKIVVHSLYFSLLAAATFLAYREGYKDGKGNRYHV